MAFSTTAMRNVANISAKSVAKVTSATRQPARVAPVRASRCLEQKAFFSGSRLFARRVQASSSQLRFVANTRHFCTSEYVIEKKGDFPSMEYRMFFKKGDQVLSPWHDIPLSNPDGTLNFVVEIPKETMAKMEVATDEASTPIKQDTKKGKLRDYPYNIHWNYGLLPQTWEDPDVKNAEVEDMAGDNDPVDVVEIGSVQHPMGTVLKVKPLGVYAMIDDGELDWKVIALDVNDPKASLVNDVDDIEEHFPGTLSAILEWFRDYKIPDGKPANKFGLEEKAMPKKYAMEVVEETHEFYKKLMSGERANTEELSLA